MKFKIKNDTWTIHRLSDLEYQAKFGDYKKFDTVAMTVYNHSANKRDIYISQSAFNRSTLAHEIMHAYLSYVHFNSVVKAKTKSKICYETEEVIVSKLDTRLPTILRLATKAYKTLR